MVAAGRIKKVWLEITHDISEEEYKKAFVDYFGAVWEEVLDAVDMSFEYNVYNALYFSAGDIKVIENVTLDQLLQEKESKQIPNIVVG